MVYTHSSVVKMNGFAACEACLQVYSAENGVYLTIHAEQRSPAMLFSDLHTEKNVQGSTLCMTSQSRAIMSVRTLSVDRKTSKE